MWRKEHEDYKCPWRDWEECLKRECPFYDEMVLHDFHSDGSDEDQRVHRCIRVLSEAKPKPLFYYKGE